MFTYTCISRDDHALTIIKSNNEKDVIMKKADSNKNESTVCESDD